MKEKIDIHAKLIDEINNSFQYIHIYIYIFNLEIDGTVRISNENMSFFRVKKSISIDINHLGIKTKNISSEHF